MLIKYEYELLSTIILNGTHKVNGDIVIPFSRIDEELLEDKLDYYLDLLEGKGIINLYDKKLIVNTKEWVEFFATKLSKIFSDNNIDVECKRKIKLNEFYIEFILNGSSKEFKLIFNNIIEHKDEKNIIFFCKYDICDDNIYWLDLLNNSNLINQFYAYLINEINEVNKTAYREINILEGLDEKYVTEIVEVSIRNYFTNQGYEIIYFDNENSNVIKKFFYTSDISGYGVKIDREILWIIKNKSKIAFISLKDSQLTYSDNIEKIINILHEKLINKVSEFKRLILFKDNNILDTNFKLIGKLSTFFVPTSMILSILSLMNVNIIFKNLVNYKPILILIIIVLGIIQIYLFTVVYWPAIKISKFNWNIK